MAKRNHLRDIKRSIKKYVKEENLDMKVSKAYLVANIFLSNVDKDDVMIIKYSKHNQYIDIYCNNTYGDPVCKLPITVNTLDSLIKRVTFEFKLERGFNLKYIKNKDSNTTRAV